MRCRHLITLLVIVIAGGAGLPAASAEQQAAAPQPGEVASLAALPAEIRLVIGPDVSTAAAPSRQAASRPRANRTAASRAPA
jgi:hypothetical protein